MQTGWPIQRPLQADGQLFVSWFRSKRNVTMSEEKAITRPAAARSTVRRSSCQESKPIVLHERKQIPSPVESEPNRMAAPRARQLRASRTGARPTRNEQAAMMLRTWPIELTEKICDRCWEQIWGVTGPIKFLPSPERRQATAVRHYRLVRHRGHTIYC